MRVSAPLAIHLTKLDCLSARPSTQIDVSENDFFSPQIRQDNPKRFPFVTILEADSKLTQFWWKFYAFPLGQ
jgi:hypothetical protein